MGDSHNGWFIMENPILKLMIWGYPHFRKPPYDKQFQTLLGSAERFMGSLFSTLPLVFGNVEDSPSGNRLR